ncbi:MAG: acetyl-CoA carboxylase biotin carboxylase subunit [Chitinophagales bacterium]|nr:acetyl-CoA carboxylase biotin carboxylase subunit [Chitinophagales bacterium]
MKQIRKLLVANRGEIACRIFGTAREMGISTVAVFSDEDAQALHVKLADEAIAIGGNKAAESYLLMDKIIAAAKQTGADAIHPGYGFLSENAAFAKRCKEEGIIFVGPSATAIEKLGSKSAAKELMRKAGVPVVPGYNGDDQNLARFEYEAEEIGYPILLKASAGGGGRGMRIVNNKPDLAPAFEAAKREAQNSFGDDKLLMEKYFHKAKHIEFQVLGDEQGNYVHLGERECSLQRRYQKVIEEAPSPSLSNELRKEMGDAAIAVARAAKYTNAGTVEFLLDEKRNYYFLEVNTRLQVEHPVTEMVTMVDLVRLQLQIAEGQPIPAYLQQAEHAPMHAIECRICAEDAANNFFPSSGTILYWREPDMENVRVDTGVETGSKVGVYYDSMLAKLIVVEESRQQAIRLLLKALDELVVLGVTTNKDFLKSLLQHPSFTDGTFDTKLIEREFDPYINLPDDTTTAEILAAALTYHLSLQTKSLSHSPSLTNWRNIFYQPHKIEVELIGETYPISYLQLSAAYFQVQANGELLNVQLLDSKEEYFYLQINNVRRHFFAAKQQDSFYVQHPLSGTHQVKLLPRFLNAKAAEKASRYVSPMPGEILKVLIKPGDKVIAGQPLLVMISMKMEMTIEAKIDGVVEEIFVAEKSFVQANSILLNIK